MNRQLRLWHCIMHIDNNSDIPQERKVEESTDGSRKAVSDVAGEAHSPKSLSKFQTLQSLLPTAGNSKRLRRQWLVGGCQAHGLATKAPLLDETAKRVKKLHVQVNTSINIYSRNNLRRGIAKLNRYRRYRKPICRNGPLHCYSPEQPY